ncbi:MAG TPA: DEAD/DEAH box helicase, partial [Sedimentibacter sp.]|nr:DEAD/DEAH box helicase [Sedimentibacter sp.]
MINEDIQYLKGVGPNRALKLQKLNIFTIEDLLNYFPVKYEDRRRVKPINEIQEQGKYLIKVKLFEKPKQSRIKKNMTMIKAICKDDSGFITLTFFNQDFLMDKLIEGEFYYVFGNVKIAFGKLEITNPEIEFEKKDWKANKIMPIYGLTYGLSNNEITKLVKTALETYYDKIQNILPEDIIKKYSLTSKKIAVRNLHFPTDGKKYSLAKRTIAFEKLLIMQLGLFNIKNNINNELNEIKVKRTDIADKLLKSIPYKLTGAQLHVIDEIKTDMKSQKTMNRLVQGDVGSGKTVVAVYAMLMAVNSGFQSSMMAPTEILAMQHYETIKEFISNANLNVSLEILTGSVKPKEKQEILKRLKGGEID